MINSVKRLIDVFLIKGKELPYVNLDENNKYKGWVTDFGFDYPAGTRMRLDLTNTEDLFGLFILAVIWSRTDYWENAAFITAYLKYSDFLKPNLWNERFCNDLQNNIANIVRFNNKTYANLELRREHSIRKDIFKSILRLKNIWSKVIEYLDWDNNGKKADYLKLIRLLENTKGLGSGENKMQVKILLILRELRCQNVLQKEIFGKLCCPADTRVRYAANRIGNKLPTDKWKASAEIYNQFGDLYDLPLFALEDLELDEELAYHFTRNTDEKIVNLLKLKPKISVREISKKIGINEVLIEQLAIFKKRGIILVDSTD